MLPLGYEPPEVLSSKFIYEKVREFLQDSEVEIIGVYGIIGACGIIGVYGMGGVGKKFNKLNTVICRGLGLPKLGLYTR